MSESRLLVFPTEISAVAESMVAELAVGLDVAFPETSRLEDAGSALVPERSEASVGDVESRSVGAPDAGAALDEGVVNDELTSGGNPPSIAPGSVVAVGGAGSSVTMGGASEVAGNTVEVESSKPKSGTKGGGLPECSGGSSKVLHCNAPRLTTNDASRPTTRANRWPVRTTRSALSCFDFTSITCNMPPGLSTLARTPHSLTH